MRENKSNKGASHCQLMERVRLSVLGGEFEARSRPSRPKLPPLAPWTDADMLDIMAVARRGPITGQPMAESVADASATIALIKEASIKVRG